MKKPIDVILRGQVELVAFPAALEQTDNVVHLAPTVRGIVSGLLGVSSGQIDIVITSDFFDLRPHWTQTLELSRKTGRFDARERVRMLLRGLPNGQARSLRPVELMVSPDTETPCSVTVRDPFALGGPSVLWQQSFRRYSHTLDRPERVGDIVRWHWTRYYHFLAWADVQGLVESFHSDLQLTYGESELDHGITLTMANRLASRRLYDMARAQGWHKLTLREQARYGLRGQWHSDADYCAARCRAEPHAPDGTSQATHRASRGGTLDYSLESDDVSLAESAPVFRHPT